MSKDRSVRFSRDIQPILDENCVVCHMPGAAQAGLTLEAGASYKAIVSVASTESKLVRIDPGKPEQSYLLLKIAGLHIKAGGQGSQMPPGAPLDKETIDVIRTWVLEGAQNN